MNLERFYIWRVYAGHTNSLETYFRVRFFYSLFIRHFYCAECDHDCPVVNNNQRVYDGYVWCVQCTMDNRVSVYECVCACIRLETNTVSRFIYFIGGCVGLCAILKSISCAHDCNLLFGGLSFRWNNFLYILASGNQNPLGNTNLNALAWHRWNKPKIITRISAMQPRCVWERRNDCECIKRIPHRTG